MSHPQRYLLRFGELSLKGRNRKLFIEDMVRIIKPRIKPLNGRLEKRHKKMLLHCDAPPEKVRKAMSTVFGLVGISPIWRAEHELDDIINQAWELMGPHANSGKTFAIKARRAQKRYPLQSPEIQRQVATALLEKGLNLKVDLSNPDLSLGINIDIHETWLHLETWPGGGGLPVRFHDKHALLLSGGIDSPVAGNLIQKRGGWLNCIYFHTPPFTVEAALEKVVDLAGVLARYQNWIRLHVVNFTEVMKTIRGDCDDAYTVILSRRLMMRTAAEIMKREKCKSIITGESLGQVASQTIENIGAINDGVAYPILRPLIGMDKQEIIKIARNLETYDISTRPFEDCCSLFSPKDPVTKANIETVRKEEERLQDIDGMIARALENTEDMDIQPDFNW